MAVYTEVSFDDATRLVANLGLGELTGLQGIRGGIENTNYFVDVGRVRYVLTLFERLTAEQLPYYLRLMQHLARRGLPVPEPQADARGGLLHAVGGKPAALVNQLRGQHQLTPDTQHCAALGRVLARMHLAGADFALHQPHLRGLDWWARTVPVVLPFLSTAQAELIQTELVFQQHLATTPAWAALPRGAVHADLFRDNAMFEGHELTGVFDFYFAGDDVLLFDIAVCLNDWCIDLDSGRLAEDRATALVDAYASQRTLTGTEQRLMPALLRAAALRFWISRLWDQHLPRDASVLTAHDPGHFERVLRARIEAPWHPALALVDAP